MTKAIGYVRVSTEEQAREGVSLAAQESRIRMFAGLYGIELVRVVIDAGQSAKTLNRPGLQDALQGLEAGEAEALLIAKLDRLTRSVADWGTLIDRYFTRRYELLSVDDKMDTRTAAGRLVLNVLISVAQWEREAIGERTAAALAHKRSRGEHVGRAPFGFRIEGSKLARVEEEARAIALIIERRGQGHALRAIADELNQQGIATQRGGRWAPQTVKNILDRVAT